VVLNLGASPARARLDLSRVPPSLLGTAPADLLTGQLLPPLSARYEVAVGPTGVAVLGGLPLDTWASLGRKNCYTGRGATYSPASSGELPLAGCLFECLQDAQCSAVTVEWLPIGAHATRVECFKRGGVTIAQCDDGADTFSTFAMQPKSE